jgi:hypothetical protein
MTLSPMNESRKHKEVRFLSYEAIDEIDEFFSGSDAGLNVDVILAKSEQAA